MPKEIFKSKRNWIIELSAIMAWPIGFLLLGEYHWLGMIVSMALASLISFFVSLVYHFHEDDFHKVRYILGFIPVKFKPQKYSDVFAFQVYLGEGAASIGGEVPMPLFIVAKSEKQLRFNFHYSYRSFEFKRIQDLMPLLIFLREQYPDKLKFHVSKKYYPKEYEFVNKFLGFSR
jgi:hypothetical protein